MGQAAGASCRQCDQDPQSRVRNGLRGSPARPLRLLLQCNRGLPRGQAPGAQGPSGARGLSVRHLWSPGHAPSATELKAIRSRHGA
ncbi:hypothetical protein NDU88_003111 [Pleurodeles waltl]|uniref:Uncharacterized protein n=1 Tax=Pleurodeles waltl TaxID=8319 RepID=A0AAV7TMI1_PLEWA|nr:hypothetical protein NDU88_003111 [Pleurodeles waltl]